MKMAFTEMRIGAEAMALIRLSNQIIEDYESQGYKLSLRQLYYQLVSRNAVPNTEQSYKRVGSIISNARECGLSDWDMIEDRNRTCIVPSHWSSPDQIVQVCARQYRIDKWADQPNYCEVMVEKQALEGVLEPVCNGEDIPFTANKGYSSSTMVYHAARKLRMEFLRRCKKMHDEQFGWFGGRIDFPDLGDRNSDRNAYLEMMSTMASDELLHFSENNGLELSEKGIEMCLPRIIVFYLGDHDPSGIDMSRDIAERLRKFSDQTPIEVRRLALNMEQIEQLRPPENPAKITDSRASNYISRFGESSWELDAIAPEQLATMVRDAISALRIDNLWEASVARETKEKKTLEKIAEDLKKKKK